MSNFNVEVAGKFATTAPFFIRSKWFATDYILVAGNGNKEIADLRGFAIDITDSLPSRFDRFRRIDFRNDHIGAHAACARSQPASTPAKTGDKQLGAGNQ